MNLTNTLTKAVVVLVASAAVLGFAFSAKAACTPTTTYGYTAAGMTLRSGAKGPAVVALQTGLKAFGGASTISTDGSYGPLTASAVKTFQSTKMLTADGIAGPMTQNALAAASATTTSCDTGNGGSNGPLTGGAGSVDEYELISGVSNEEVGEDEEDVQVLGLEITADDGSDLNFTAMKVMFEQGASSNSNFDDYATEVSIWYGNEEVARVDVDDFGDEEDSDSDSKDEWTKTISFDEDAIVREGDTEKFYVALSGASNLDSSDAGDSWTIDVTSVRFEDADGAVITEDPTISARTATFETFATATDLELKVKSEDEEVNDAHIIDVHATDDTDGVEVLSFSIEIEGDSEVVVSEIPVNFDVTGATNVDDMVSTVSLYMDDEEIGSENLGSGVGADETVTFDDLDLTLEGGETYEFLVKVDFLSIADALDAGDTISAQLSSTEVDAIEAEDETGEDLAAADLTGTAVGEASAVYDSGIMVKLVSTDADISDAGDAGVATSAQTGTFDIVFDVTAFGDDIRIDDDADEDTSTFTTVTQLSYSLTGDTNIADTTATNSFTTLTGATHNTESFLVEEGETERFKISVAATATTSTYTDVKLEGIGWTAGSADAVGANIYTFNLDQFIAGPLFLIEYD